MSGSGMTERHFTPRTLAEVWCVSEDTVVRWFRDEAGVLKIAAEGRRKRGGRVSLRIPESVALRVYRERSR